jgi:hypothetical protein
MCWDQVRFPIPDSSSSLDSWRILLILDSSLAYCELYCTLGTIFRRFENLQSNRLTEEDLSYNDYFTTHHPIGAAKFHVMAAEQK